MVLVDFGLQRMGAQSIDHRELDVCGNLPDGIKPQRLRDELLQVVSGGLTEHFLDDLQYLVAADLLNRGESFQVEVMLGSVGGARGLVKVCPPCRKNGGAGPNTADPAVDLLLIGNGPSSSIR